MKNSCQRLILNSVCYRKPVVVKRILLVVFWMGGLEQNENLPLTHVSDTVFHALSQRSLHFVLPGSLINHLFQRILLAVEENQPIKK